MYRKLLILIITASFQLRSARNINQVTLSNSTLSKSNETQAANENDSGYIFQSIFGNDTTTQDSVLESNLNNQNARILVQNNYLDSVSDRIPDSQNTTQAANEIDSALILKSIFGNQYTAQDSISGSNSNNHTVNVTGIKDEVDSVSDRTPDSQNITQAANENDLDLLSQSIVSNQSTAKDLVSESFLNNQTATVTGKNDDVDSVLDRISDSQNTTQAANKNDSALTLQSIFGNQSTAQDSVSGSNSNNETVIVTAKKDDVDSVSDRTPDFQNTIQAANENDSALILQSIFGNQSTAQDSVQDSQNIWETNQPCSNANGTKGICIPDYFCDTDSVIYKETTEGYLTTVGLCESIMEVCCLESKETQVANNEDWGPTLDVNDDDLDFLLQSIFDPQSAKEAADDNHLKEVLQRVFGNQITNQDSVLKDILNYQAATITEKNDDLDAVPDNVSDPHSVQQAMEDNNLDSAITNSIENQTETHDPVLDSSLNSQAATLTGNKDDLDLVQDDVSYPHSVRQATKDDNLDSAIKSFIGNQTETHGLILESSLNYQNATVTGKKHDLDAVPHNVSSFRSAS